MRMKDEEWDAVIATNLTCGVPPVARRVARHDEGAQRPHHQYHSVVGSSGNPGRSNYAAAKAGVAGMTPSAGARNRQPQHHRQLRRAGLHRYRHDQGADRRAAHRAARRRFRWAAWAARKISPHAVAFLASPQRGYITGTTLHVNGGMYM